MAFRFSLVITTALLSAVLATAAGVGHDEDERLELRMAAHPGDTAGLTAAGDAAQVADRATHVQTMATDHAPVNAEARARKPTEWPELVGQDANHAKEVIEAFGYNVFLVPEGSAVTMDYRTSRVRIYVDKNNKVQAVPRIG